MTRSIADPAIKVFITGFAAGLFLWAAALLAPLAADERAGGDAVAERAVEITATSADVFDRELSSLAAQIANRTDGERYLVYFREGERALSPEAREAITLMADEIVAMDYERVTVRPISTGFVTATLDGSSLGRDRAFEVAAALEEAGVPARWIAVDGDGLGAVSAVLPAGNGF